jgi:hypothetical protein
MLVYTQKPLFLPKTMVFGKKEGPPQNHASKFHANKA